MTWLTNKHGATIFAVTLAMIIAALPAPDTPVTFGEAVSGEVPQSYLECNADLPAAATAGGLARSDVVVDDVCGEGRSDFVAAIRSHQSIARRTGLPGDLVLPLAAKHSRLVHRDSDAVHAGGPGVGHAR